MYGGEKPPRGSPKPLSTSARRARSPRILREARVRGRGRVRDRVSVVGEAVGGVGGCGFGEWVLHWIAGLDMVGLGIRVDRVSLGLVTRTIVDEEVHYLREPRHLNSNVDS